MATDKSALAGEYVLGTLPEAERLAVERAVDRDPEFAAEIEGWRARLAGLDAVGPDVVPSPGVWDSIAARLPPAAPRDASGEDTVVELRRKASIWRTSTIMTGLVAAGLAAVLVLGPKPIPPVVSGERYIAAVDRGGELPALLVDVDLATGQISIVSVAAEPPQGRSYELWYIGEGSDPLSLGLVDDGSPHSISLAQVGDFAPQGALFAISDEPLGGSPTGAPTGEVVFTGTLIPVSNTVETID